VIGVREKNILKSSSLERRLHVFWNLEALICKKFFIKETHSVVLTAFQHKSTSVSPHVPSYGVVYFDFFGFIIFLFGFPSLPLLKFDI